MTDTEIRVVPCHICGNNTPMTGTKECDLCYEVMSRIVPFLGRCKLATLSVLLRLIDDEVRHREERA